MSGEGTRGCGRLVAAAALLTALAAGVVLWRPFRLGADDWVWPPVEAPAWDLAVGSMAALALVGALVVVAWGRTGTRRGVEGLAVALLVVFAVAAQVKVGQQATAGYHESIIALGRRGSSSYHEAARGIVDLRELLGRYAVWMREPWRAQISTHPAGPVTLFWWLNQAFASDQRRAAGFVRWCEGRLTYGVGLRETAWGGRLFAQMTPAQEAGAWLASFALRLAAALTVVPVYLLARRLHGPDVALAAAGLTAAIPSLALFSPLVDVAFPVLAAAACWLGYRAGEARSLWRTAACGFVVSLGLLVTLAFSVVALWAALLAVAGLCRGEGCGGPAQVAKLAGAGLVGLLVPVGVLYVVFRYDSFAVWRACWDGNAEFNARSQRTYWKWLLLNPVEFLAFLGVPVAVLFVRRAASEARALARRRVTGRDWPTLIVAGLLVALNVLGANLGEVGRLWLFLMPGCAIAAAAELQRCAPYRRAAFAVFFALLSVQLVVFKASLQTLNIY